MLRHFRAAAFLGACALSPAAAHAHAVAGDRLFPVTLTIDDPGVADEASVPTFSWQRSDAGDGPGAVDTYTFQFEYDKRITERFGVGISDAYVITDTAHDKRRTGFSDLAVTLKYQAYVDPAREFILSVGLERGFGRTGTVSIAAEKYGDTTVNAYAGKGFGDAPVPLLKPLAVTGVVGYTVADRAERIAADGTSNQGTANSVNAGFSVQYSLPYLEHQVRATGLPGWATRMIPLVEVAYTAPTGGHAESGTQVTIAPGVIYEGAWYQLGIEALIPATRAAGTHVGVIAQFHLFLDDLLPNSLGKPLLDF